MNSRTRQLSTLLTMLLVCLSLGGEALGLDEIEFIPAHVVVYGATPAGVAAALGAAENPELRVLLVEPTLRIGGMTTNGLSHTDFRTFEGLSGTFLEFTKRVEAHYQPLGQETFRGTFSEPKVNLQVFEAMLAERPNIMLKRGHAVESKVYVSQRRLVEVDFNGKSESFRTRAKIYIDATYEGDLMARAGVPYAVGREGKLEYGETLAPDEPDDQLQGYNFRFCMTNNAANRVPVVAPAGYQREDFLPLVTLLNEGKFNKVFDYPTGCLYKAQTPALPFDKYDINDVSKGLVRLSLPGSNNGWPDGTPEQRREIFNEHLRHNVGMLYFLQNDVAVPVKFQEEAREWGFCKDEFVETNHLPDQLYIREARRMRGWKVFTEHNTANAPGDARSVLQRDSIAIGDYGLNCHGTAHEGPRIGGTHTGEFYRSVAPYQIPYGVMLTEQVENLLVPVAASSSHVGFCALRLEPVWTSLGQAAGHAAGLAIRDEKPLMAIDIAELQSELHRRGSATIYVSDCLPGSPDYADVQWWGTRGGLHGLAPTPDKPGQRGTNIHGQYYEAYPFHAVELDRPLDDALKAHWLDVARSAGIEVDGLESAATRGEFIRRAFQRTQTEEFRKVSRNKVRAEQLWAEAMLESILEWEDDSHASIAESKYLDAIELSRSRLRAAILTSVAVDGGEPAAMRAMLDVTAQAAGLIPKADEPPEASRDVQGNQARWRQILGAEVEANRASDAVDSDAEFDELLKTVRGEDAMQLACCRAALQADPTYHPARRQLAVVGTPATRAAAIADWSARDRNNALPVLTEACLMSEQGNVERSVELLLSTRELPYCLDPAPQRPQYFRLLYPDTADFQDYGIVGQPVTHEGMDWLLQVVSTSRTAIGGSRGRAYRNLGYRIAEAEEAARAAGKAVASHDHAAHVMAAHLAYKSSADMLDGLTALGIVLTVSPDRNNQANRVCSKFSREAVRPRLSISREELKQSKGNLIEESRAIRRDRVWYLLAIRESGIWEATMPGPLPPLHWPENP